LALYFTFNIAVILTWYCEDERLPDRDIFLTAFLFGMPFVIGVAFYTFFQNHKKKKLKDAIQNKR